MTISQYPEGPMDELGLQPVFGGGQEYAMPGRPEDPEPTTPEWQPVDESTTGYGQRLKRAQQVASKVVPTEADLITGGENID